MHFFNRTGVVFAACLTLCLTLAQPAGAIQNIGFPDDQSISVSAGDAKKFNTARDVMQDALSTLLKIGDIKGESTRAAAALKSVATNSDVMKSVAEKSGNKDVVRFMSTLRSWATSGDAEDRSPELIKKILSSVRGLKTVKK